MLQCKRFFAVQWMRMQSIQQRASLVRRHTGNGSVVFLQFEEPAVAPSCHALTPAATLVGFWFVLQTFSQAFLGALVCGWTVQSCYQRSLHTMDKSEGSVRCLQNLTLPVRLENIFEKQVRKDFITTL